MYKNRLKELSEEKYQKFSASLIPNINNILGVRTPILRKLAKEIYLSENKKKFLEQTNFEYMEEIMLQGMVIGLLKDSPEKILEYVKNFIPKIDNWGVCDNFCCGLKFTQNNKHLVWDFILPYLDSKKEYDIRFVVVMFLNYFIEDEYVDKILEYLGKIRHEEYYVKMAIAWAVSICYIKYPQKTHLFLKKNILDIWTHNKSIQKIIESYRIDSETKNILRQMKRK